MWLPPVGCIPVPTVCNPPFAGEFFAVGADISFGVGRFVRAFDPIGILLVDYFYCNKQTFAVPVASVSDDPPAFTTESVAVPFDVISHSICAAELVADVKDPIQKLPITDPSNDIFVDVTDEETEENPSDVIVLMVAVLQEFVPESWIVPVVLIIVVPFIANAYVSPPTVVFGTKLIELIFEGNAREPPG